MRFPQTSLVARSVFVLDLLLFGAVYPCLAALDADRETLYLNISAFIFLAIAAWLIAQRTGALAASVSSQVNPVAAT